ncbi:NUDIX domain-containing protein [Candidatus Parcubacteria bacterium]|nr:NUDIX domain-containing protein [Candidatus Parcubacteria bacterium]
MDKTEEKILKTIKEFAKKLPKFPDGRIDYSNSDIAPVITVFIKYKDKILLLKRSNKVRVYQEKWNTIAGYLDEIKPVREKIVEEIKEEIGISEDNISSIHIGEPYEFTDAEVNKIWIVCPVSVELRNEPNIKLDWEHTEYKWIKPEELKKFDVVFNLDKSLENVFK